MTTTQDALQAIVDANDQPVFALDRDLRYLAFNRAHATIMRALYGAEIAVGGRLPDYQTVTADREAAMANLERALVGERIVAGAESGQEGHRRAFEVVHSPLTDADGTVIGVVVRASDVTERELAERDLLESETRHRDLFERMPQGVVYQDAEGRITAANVSAERILGLTLDQMRGRTSMDPRWRAIHEDGTAFPGEEHPISIALRTGREVHDVVMGVFDPRLDRVTWMKVGAAAQFRIGEHKPHGAFVTFDDITERKLAEAELRETRDYLENLFGYANAPVIVWDQKLRITRFNQAFEQLAQRTAAEVVGRHLGLLFPDDERRQEALAHVTSATAGERLEVVEIPILRADGEIRTVLWNSATIYEADGTTPLATIAQGQDITERVAAEQAVRGSEKKFRSLFESMTEGVALHELVADVQGEPLDYRILDMNPAYEAQTGVRAAAVRGKLSRDAYGTDEAPFLAEYARTARTGEPTRFQTYFAPLEKHFDITVVANGAGRFATVFEDITERVAAEAQIRRLNAELEDRVTERTRDLTAANAELEEFVHSIAHDLRSPLRALSGFSDLVQADYDDVIDDTGRDYLRRIHDAAHHLGDLMDALLSLSQVSRRELVDLEVDLSALAREAAARLGEAEPERIVELEIEDGLVANGDPALCEIIVQNLLGNAWKFSAGEAPARIRFAASCIDGRRAYCVGDNGVGFDPAYTEKLFQPFERLHTTAQFPGTGIGLATVRRAVMRLGGRCWAEGTLGKGAQVWFTLGESC